MNTNNSEQAQPRPGNNRIRLHKPRPIRRGLLPTPIPPRQLHQPHPRNHPEFP